MFWLAWRRYLRSTPDTFPAMLAAASTEAAMDPDSPGTIRTDRHEPTSPLDPRPRRRGLIGRTRRIGRLSALAAVVGAALIAVVLALSAVHLLPQLRNPFAETTVDRSSPALLKSISALSRYEAASGSFQVVVELDQRTSWLPMFIEGTQTLFVGQGTDIAFVDFSKLKGSAIKVSHNRTWVAITVPRARLEPAVLDVRRSYVFAQQQGLLNRIGNFFSGNPNSQHQVYVLAQKKIQSAAEHSELLIQAQRNTRTMLIGLMRSLGFQQVTVTFGPA
jgi:uncharacterized protein DUF4230